jgi:hypothetical protein
MSFGAEFLRFPDLFPGRPAGEPWGDRSLALDVAGGPYRFSGLSAVQAAAVRERFGGLCGDPAGGEAVAVRVFRAPAADFAEIDTRGWEYALDFDYAPGSVRVAGMRLMVRLDWPAGFGHGLGGSLWTCETAGEEWTSVFENAFRVLAAYRLLETGGALIHSAGIAGASLSGEAAGYLLLGPSGAGKTTASRLALEEGATVLSDDLNAVVREGEEARMVKLPFTGDLGDRAGAPASVPLRALLRLAKGDGEKLRPLSRAAALGGLVAASPFVGRDPWRREALLDRLERLARVVPAWELTFPLGARLWSILRSIPPISP